MSLHRLLQIEYSKPWVSRHRMHKRNWRGSILLIWYISQDAILFQFTQVLFDFVHAKVPLFPKLAKTIVLTIWIFLVFDLKRSNRLIRKQLNALYLGLNVFALCKIWSVWLFWAVIYSALSFLSYDISIWLWHKGFLYVVLSRPEIVYLLLLIEEHLIIDVVTVFLVSALEIGKAPQRYSCLQLLFLFFALAVWAMLYGKIPTIWLWKAVEHLPFWLFCLNQVLDRFVLLLERMVKALLVNVL